MNGDILQLIANGIGILTIVVAVGLGVVCMMLLEISQAIALHDAESEEEEQV